MKSIRFLFCFFFILSIIILSSCGNNNNTMNLAGEWQFKLDPDGKGVDEQWYTTELEGTIHLPGSLQEQGYGEVPNPDTKWIGRIRTPDWLEQEPWKHIVDVESDYKVPFWLTPDRYYRGKAWYQRKIQIPAGWQGKSLELVFERAHWQTTVWMDSERIGSCNSLAAPHRYAIKDLAPGEHTISVCVDNEYLLNVGIDAHSVSDHTQSNWNGLVGALSLRALPDVRIADVQVYPDYQKKQARVKIMVENTTNATINAQLELNAATTANSPDQHMADLKSSEIELLPGESIHGLTLHLGEDAVMWNEFKPNLYNLAIDLKSGSEKDHKETVFGLRNIATQGTQITINGQKTFLRGTLECCIFPLTGYPDTSVEGWRKIFRQIKAYGLNHMRFHSYTPPEAAFSAADMEGVYLQTEIPVWTNPVGDTIISAFMTDEAKRILREYGNHPSFTMLCAGNELGPNRDEPKRDAYLSSLIESWRSADDRHLYASGSGWPSIAAADYQIRSEPRVFNWLNRYTSRIDAAPLEMTVDYTEQDAMFKGPVVSHEIGQWCVYPNLDETKKYTGVLKAKNFDLARTLLEEKGMGSQAQEFLMASGKFQTILYKEEVEAALRTPNHAGFQLLDLHDFPGQGSAIVGVLDAFWEEKGYVSAAEFSRFCNATVPLARIKKLTWTTNEQFAADIEVSHFGAEILRDVEPVWEIRDLYGRTLAQGSLEKTNIQIGNAQMLGKVTFDLNAIDAAMELKLVVKLGETGFENDWLFWVYPVKVEMNAGDVRIVNQLDDKIIDFLENGGDVLLTRAPDDIPQDKAFGFASIFWNKLWFPGQPAYALGLVNRVEHPALEAFPTEFHSNWQWWDLTLHSRDLVLDDLPDDLRPIVQVIDDWNTARKLGLLFEADYGKGRIMVCGSDIVSNLNERPVARQFRKSILDYMNSSMFKPPVELSNPDLEVIAGQFGEMAF